MSMSETTALFISKFLFNDVKPNIFFLSVSNYLPLNEKYWEFKESIAEVALVVFA